LSTKVAKDLARKARKIAPASLYEFARTFERALEALADEIEELKQARTKDTTEPTKRRGGTQW
jgi:hypothetical protein